MAHKHSVGVSGLGCLVLAALALAADLPRAFSDDVERAVAVAEEAYALALEDVEAMVDDEFAELIAAAAEAGDIESVTELQSQQDIFRRRGFIVEDYHLRSFRTRVRSGVSAAYRGLDDAYTEAIKRYTQARDFDKARSVLDVRSVHREHGRLRAEEGVLYLPRAHRKQDDDEPPAGNDMGGGPPTAPPSAGLDISAEFLTALNTGGEREVIGDRLLPLKERQAALKTLIYRMYRNYSPTQWSHKECEHFALFVRESVLRFNENCNMWWPSRFEVVGGVILPAGEINTGSTPERMATAGYVHAFRAWICTAPSLESFIDRVTLAQSDSVFRTRGGAWDSIDGVIGTSDLKHWFRCVGIDDFGQARAAAAAWAEAKLQLTACRKVADELDVPWQQ